MDILKVLDDLDVLYAKTQVPEVLFAPGYKQEQHEFSCAVQNAYPLLAETIRKQQAVIEEMCEIDVRFEETPLLATEWWAGKQVSKVWRVKLDAILAKHEFKTE